MVQGDDDRGDYSDSNPRPVIIPQEGLKPWVGLVKLGTQQEG